MRLTPSLVCLLSLGLCGALLSATAAAQAPQQRPEPATAAADLPAAPPPPALDLSTLPPKAEPDDALVPEITIQSAEDGTRVEEYRENGRLLFVRVVPARGVPYTLIDADGDGEVDRPRPMSNEVLPVFYELKLPSADRDGGD